MLSSGIKVTRFTDKRGVSIGSPVSGPWWVDSRSIIESVGRECGAWRAVGVRGTVVL
jgi:hypothetical protein